VCGGRGGAQAWREGEDAEEQLADTVRGEMARAEARHSDELAMLRAEHLAQLDQRDTAEAKRAYPTARTVHAFAH
jgi:hypothetical protein